MKMGMMLALIGAFLMLYGFHGALKYVPKSHEREDTIGEVNFLLGQEGYKIYFRITEHNQISLVHPR